MNRFQFLPPRLSSLMAFHEMIPQKGFNDSPQSFSDDKFIIKK